MLPTVPLLRAGGVYNSLDVQDITPAQGGDVVAQITMSNSGLIKRDLLDCLLYTSPSPRDLSTSRMPSSA